MRCMSSTDLQLTEPNGLCRRQDQAGQRPEALRIAMLKGLPVDMLEILPVDGIGRLRHMLVGVNVRWPVAVMTAEIRFALGEAGRVALPSRLIGLAILVVVLVVASRGVPRLWTMALVGSRRRRPLSEARLPCSYAEHAGDSRACKSFGLPVHRCSPSRPCPRTLQTRSAGGKLSTGQPFARLPCQNGNVRKPGTPNIHCVLSAVLQRQACWN